MKVLKPRAVGSLRATCSQGAPSSTRHLPFHGLPDDTSIPNRAVDCTSERMCKAFWVHAR